MHKSPDLNDVVYFERCSQLINILSNPKRLQIVLALASSEQSVKRLANHVNLSPSALSQHLAKMRDAGVVRTRREGVVVYYCLAVPELTGLVNETVLLIKEYSKKT